MKQLMFIARIEYTPIDGGQTQIFLYDLRGSIVYDDRWYCPPSVEGIAETCLRIPLDRMAFCQYSPGRWEVYLVI